MAYVRGYGLRIDMQDAARIHATWMQAWPEVEGFFAFVRGCTVPDSGGELYYVNHHREGRIRNKCRYTAACNSHFQGLAAAGAKAALWRLCCEQHDPRAAGDSPLYGTHLAAFIHDEIIIECPIDRVHEAAQRLRTVMVEEFNRFVPDCPTDAEPVAMLRWSKAAKPVFDEQGRLIPWEPTKHPDDDEHGHGE